MFRNYKRFLIIAALMFSRSLSGQIMTQPLLQLSAQTERSNNPSIYIYSDAEAASNCLTGALFNDYFFSSTFSESSRSSVVSLLKSKNRMGIQTQYGAMYTWPALKKHQRTQFVQWEYRTQQSAIFTPDMYKIMAFGNEPYAGKTAVFSGSQLHKALYQQIQYGFYGPLNKRWSGGISFGLSGAMAAVSIRIPSGSLYTSSEGDSLRLAADIHARKSIVKPGFFNFQGFGASIGGFLKYDFRTSGSLTFAVADLGFLNFSYNKSSSIHLSGDWTFTGGEISVVNGGFRISRFQDAPDSIAAAIKSGWKPGSNFFPMPAQLYIALDKPLSKTFSVYAASEYILFYNHIPALLAQGRSKISRLLTIGYGFEAGGYGKAGLSAFIQATPERWKIFLGSNHLESVAIPKTTTGESFYFGLGYRF